MSRRLGRKPTRVRTPLLAHGVRPQPPGDPLRRAAFMDGSLFAPSRDRWVDQCEYLSPRGQPVVNSDGADVHGAGGGRPVASAGNSNFIPG